jgi:hypothetical protein
LRNGEGSLQPAQSSAQSAPSVERAAIEGDKSEARAPVRHRSTGADSGVADTAASREMSAMSNDPIVPQNAMSA